MNKVCFTHALLAADPLISKFGHMALNSLHLFYVLFVKYELKNALRRLENFEIRLRVAQYLKSKRLFSFQHVISYRLLIQLQNSNIYKVKNIRR